MAAAWGSLTPYVWHADAQDMLADEYQMSDGVDLGATPLHGVFVQVEVDWAATPDVDDFADFWLAQGIESTSANLAGEVTGTKNVYTLAKTANMTFLGRLLSIAVTTSQAKQFWVPAPSRYHVCVIHNASISPALTALEVNYVTRLLA